MHPTGPDVGPPNTTEKAMTRMSRSRVAVTTSLALGTTALGMAMAPAAFAVETLPAVEGDTTATIGEPFVLTGEGCANPADGAHADEPTTVYVDFYTAAGWEDPSAEPVLSLDGTPEDGAWTAAAVFSAAAPVGDYVVDIVCDTYDSLEPYPVFEFTLEAAAVTSTPSTPSSTPTGAIRGTAANTPGVASVKTGATTTAAPAPGTKVVKVYKGFQPGEKVTVTMHSTPVVLGTDFTANANGEVTVQFTVPAGTPAGTHTLVLNGNMGTYFQEDITVVAAVTTASSSGLAYTGADVAVPLALGAGLLALGGGALVVSRRRTGATQA
jgi:hypothetical protein